MQPRLKRRKKLERSAQRGPPEFTRGGQVVADEGGHVAFVARCEPEVHETSGVDRALLAARAVAPSLAHVAAAVPQAAAGHDLAIFFEDRHVVPVVDPGDERWFGAPEKVIEAAAQRFDAVGAE